MYHGTVLLAQKIASSPSTETFNSDFYVAVATVMPILLLANGLWSDYFKDAPKLVEEHPTEANVNRNYNHNLFFLITVPFGTAYSTIAALVILAFRKDDVFLRVTVTVVASLLVLYTLFGVYRVLVRAAREKRDILLKAVKRAAAGRPVSPEDDTVP